MFANYLASAVRNLLRNRLYSMINIGGLAIGLATAILIGLYVRQELTYDQFLPDYERVFRLSSSMGTMDIDPVPPSLAPLLKATLPQIEAIARLVRDSATIKRGAVRSEETIWWTDPEFFQVVKLPAITGDPLTALSRPDAAVITRGIARKYFGKDTPVDETLEVNGNSVRIAAVIEDLPSTTHLNTKIFMAGGAAASRLANPADGNSLNAYTYLRLASPESAAVRDALPEVVKSWGAPAQDFKFRLTNVADIHLAKIGMGTMKPGGDLATIYALAAIGCLVLFAASINFVNLMTARATRRALEVGVRKAAGARKRDLILQFIGESILYVAISMVVAVALVELSGPAIAILLESKIALEYWRDPMLAATLSMLVLTLGVLAGAYPAFVLSGFRPIAVFNDASARVGSTRIVRQILVIAQFSILIGLLFATAVTYRQTLFAIKESVRRTADAIYLVLAPCRGGFADGVRALPGVRRTTCADQLPLRADRVAASWNGTGGKYTEMQTATVDLDFFEFYGLQARAGRLFSKDYPGDIAPTSGDKSARAAVVINETALKVLGVSSAQQALGRAPPVAGLDYPAEVIGVVEDFPVGSVREKIPPIVFNVTPAGFSSLHVQLVGKKTPETITAIEQLWKRFEPNKTLRARFLDRAVEEQYADLRQQTRTIGAFASIALFIGCLGLFGLSVFNAERRTKEIGVRKAMGAQTSDVMRLLTWQFIKPVLWANLLAWPLSAWVMQRWLNGFAYRIDLDAWLFVAASTIALCIAVITVAGHCYLAARSKPVNSLRYE